MLGGHLINGLAYVLDMLLNMVSLLVIVSIVISFLDAPRHNQIVQMVESATRPLYAPFRGFSSKISNRFDLSPVFVLLIVGFLQTALVPWLRDLAHTFS